MKYLSDEIRRALLRRDQVLLDQLFREINPVLCKTMAGERLSPEDTEELLHQTWLTFLEKLDSFEGRSQIKTFLIGILINKLHELRRSKKRFQSVEDADQAFQNAFTVDGWWKTDPPDPEELMSSKEVGRWIEECLQGLSVSQKDAFVLREIQGEDSEVICKILQVNVTHLGVLIFRAKEKLRKCLEGSLGVRGST